MRSTSDRYASWERSPRRRDIAFHLDSLRKLEASAEELIMDYDKGVIGEVTLNVVRRKIERSAAQAITAALIMWLATEVP